MIKLDLHVHTTYSDASETIYQVLEKAKKKRLKYIAITDHDTCINLENKEELEFYYGIKIVTGIELTTNYKRVHILGLGLKKDKLKVVEKVAKNYQRLQIEAVALKANKLIEDGVNLTMSEIYSFAKNGWLTQNSIARAMISKNMVSSYEEADAKYFYKGSPYKAPVIAISIEEAIDLIKFANGVPVLAHPWFSRFSRELDEMEKEIQRIVSLGIEGIETYYGKNTKEQDKYIAMLAEKYNLFKTAGSDYHAQPKRDKLGMYLNDTEILKYIY